MPVLKYKDGNEWKVASKNVAYEVSDIPAPTQEELTFGNTTGYTDFNFSYFNYNGIWDWFITKYKDKIQLKRVRYCNYMFYNSKLTSIPFKINLNSVGNNYSLSMNNIIENSKIQTLDNVFVLPPAGSFKQVGLDNCFYSAKYLRKIPTEVLELTKLENSNKRNLIYFNGFRFCYVLDEIIGLGAPIMSGKMTYNAFVSTFDLCQRLKRLTFDPNQVVEWKGQIIDLTKTVGYGSYADKYGFSSTKQIKDDATYQALKDDPDSWTSDINYSRYNRISAVETINSLPDTSAYLATAGGTNTIKFEGAQGAKTDGGAINTMTEEEIAVATAKGWTVSFV